jgi:hypothetical protein
VSWFGTVCGRLLRLITARRISQVTYEDVNIVESTQRCLDGGGYCSPGVLSPRHEQGVGYFQKLVREAHARGGMTY